MFTWIRNAIRRSDIQVERTRRAFRKNLSSRLKRFLTEGTTLRLKTDSSPDIAIILVAYNQAEFVYGCLSSIAEAQSNSPLKYEIIIFDNGSTDQMFELFERVSGIKIIRSSENLHYLRGTNRASEHAVAKHLLFLNSDAQIFPGTLDAALSTIESASNVGAVGGRTVWPNGLLQEAGCTVWNDGTCDHYGRHDIPTAAQYMFLREVDYCSASFLLTPRDLFHRMKRFDEVYSPAYYEDADYCLRLRKAGYRTLYEPDARVFHYEHASINVEQMLSLMEKNRKIFADRHADVLADQLPPSEENRLRARTSRMPKRLIFISDHLPDSKASQINQIFKDLFKIGVEVTFFPTVFIPDDWQRLRTLLPKTVEVMAGLKSPNLARFFDCRPDFYDGILIGDISNKKTLVDWIIKNRRRVGKTKLIDSDLSQLNAQYIAARL